jgi:hypothetical protein
MNALIRLKKTTPVFVIAFVLAWFALSPATQAVVPPPDGGYPGFNTAEVKRPFLASPPALGMWQLGGVRSIATLKAALTRLSAQERSF